MKVSRITKRAFLVVLLLGVAALFAQPVLHAAGAFIGSKSCRYCHEAQYNAWKQGPHSRAFHHLPHEKKQASGCVGCHATAPAEGLDSVECESCHGAGAHYSKSYIMRDGMLAEAAGLIVKDEAVCRKCHTDSQPSVRPFSFESFWKRLPHSTTSEKK